MGVSVGDSDRSTPTVGGFTFAIGRDEWVWSSEVAVMHGRPAGFTPTTAEVLAHKHPDDLPAVQQMFGSGTAGPWRSHHRIVRTDERIREVIVVAFPARADDPETEIEGFYIDVTEALERDRQQAVTRAMVDIAERRAVIEQAKGMLMLVYRISPDRAFDVLKWLSQRANIKIHTIADELVHRLRNRPADHPLGREEFDRLLLTVGAVAPATGPTDAD